MTTQQWQLVGDIGGTNARFGAVTPASREPTLIATYQVADFPTFNDVLGTLVDDAAKDSG